MILIVVPILALAIAAIIITASPRYTVMQQKIDHLHNGIGETITNERVIKSFVREEHEKEKFSRINQELVEKSTAALRMMILMQPVSTLAINVTTLAVVWFAGKQIMVGTISIQIHTTIESIGIILMNIQSRDPPSIILMVLPSSNNTGGCFLWKK